MLVFTVPTCMYIPAITTSFPIHVRHVCNNSTQCFIPYSVVSTCMAYFYPCIYYMSYLFVNKTLVTVHPESFMETSYCTRIIYAMEFVLCRYLYFIMVHKTETHTSFRV